MKNPLATSVKTLGVALALALLLQASSANAAASSVQVGASVEFKQYVLVKMLDQYFSVAVDMKNQPVYEEHHSGNQRIIVIQ